MEEAEIRNMLEEELQELLDALITEKARRTRLEGATGQVAYLVTQIRADGGDPDQIIADGQAMADA